MHSSLPRRLSLVLLTSQKQPNLEPTKVSVDGNILHHPLIHKMNRNTLELPELPTTIIHRNIHRQITLRHLEPRRGGSGTLKVIRREIVEHDCTAICHHDPDTPAQIVSGCITVGCFASGLPGGWGKDNLSLQLGGAPWLVAS